MSVVTGSGHKRKDTHISIERQTRGYKREDPTTVHEKALPAIIFRHLLEHALTPRQKARANLVCGALFFACRSCEYSHVGNIDDRKTGPIRVKDIVFRIGNRVIPHDSRYLLHADSVSIDFGDQKSEIKNETVTICKFRRRQPQPHITLDIHHPSPSLIPWLQRRLGSINIFRWQEILKDVFQRNPNRSQSSSGYNRP